MVGSLVSVVIPSYNHESYIVHTIQSIIDQTYQNIEIVIVNDGSPDNSKDVIASMMPSCEERFVRAVFIDRENQGLMRTLNEGVAAAKGEYIYIIASDDSARPEAIETLHDFLSEHHEYVLAVGNNHFMDDKGAQTYWNEAQENVYDKSKATYISFAEFLQKSRPDIDFHSDDFGDYRNLLLGNHVPNGYLIRKKSFDAVGGYSEDAPVEDMYLMMQLSKIGKLKYIDKVLFNYRWHNDNTIKKRDVMLKAFYKTMKVEEHYALQNGFEKEFNMVTSRKVIFAFLGLSLRKEKAFKDDKFVRKFTLNISKKSYSFFVSRN